MVPTHPDQFTFRKLKGLNILEFRIFQKYGILVGAGKYIDLVSFPN
jgi:hypothetical protein